MTFKVSTATGTVYAVARLPYTNDSWVLLLT